MDNEEGVSGEKCVYPAGNEARPTFGIQERIYTGVEEDGGESQPKKQIRSYVVPKVLSHVILVYHN